MLKEDKHTSDPEGFQIEGVEPKQLFPRNEQGSIILDIAGWFELNKDLLPEQGINIVVPRINADGTPLDSLKNLTPSPELPGGVKIPPAIVELFDAVMSDSAHDGVLARKTPYLSLRRTGVSYTHPDNMKYHLDTNYHEFRVDGTFHRSPERSTDKYLAFIDRPGSLVIHGKINPELTQQEGTSLVKKDPHLGQATVSQLLPNSVYRLAVGDLLHSAPPHEDGLLFEVSFIDPQEAE